VDRAEARYNGVMKRAALYARVSTGGQTVENQLRELRAVAKRLGWEVVEEFVDEGISGTKGRDKRPALDRMLKSVIRGEVEVVAAWSVDRLGRSLQDLVGLLSDIRARNVDLYLHQQGLDTATPSGRAMYQMLGVFAEFERAIIVERINAGLARAKAQGRRGGRPEVTSSLIADMRALRAQGHSLRFIGDRLGVGLGTVAKYVKAVRE
jgi:DNA invertase Pin-like site-specific DNA recombinase